MICKGSVVVARAMNNLKRVQERRNHLSRRRSGIVVTDDEPLFSGAGYACSGRASFFCECDLVEVAQTVASKEGVGRRDGYVTRMHL